MAAYASRAGEKLRLHGLVAGRLAAFCHTSPHREGPYFHGQRGTRLMPMTCDTRELVAAALRCLEAAWPGHRGLSFIKAGVLLDDLCTPEAAQPGPFDGGVKGSAKLMAAMDALNARYGRNTVFPAAMGIERGWKLRAAHHSPRYTTRLDELPAVRA